MITVFENEEFGSVRTVIEDGRILFCAKDVAKSLGYVNPRKAILDHCRCVTKRDVPHPQSSGRLLEMSFIPEGDVYRLIVGSKLPAAEKFETWLFDTVVPSIRKYGMYATTPMLRQFQENPELIRLVCERMLTEKDRADKLDKKVTELQPKADFFDAFVNPDDCTNIRTTAKELGVPERAFCRFLQDAGFMYRCPAGNLMPYNKPENEGLFIVRDFYSECGHHGTYTLITSMGKNLLRNLLVPERKDA